MRLGIVGLGYWGKNIVKVLSGTEHELILCDPFLQDRNAYANYNFCDDYRDLECDSVFIIVPASRHYEICKHFLSKGVSTFCEKPLCLDLYQARELYSLAEENSCYLMVDWIFSFNKEIQFIKSEIGRGTFGDIKYIHCERLNKGPVRTDVNAKWDLSSHDVSIITYLFNEKPHTVTWNNTSRDPKSRQADTSLGILNYKDFYALIHSSWEYDLGKSRRFLLEFDKCVISWDDGAQTVDIDGEDVSGDIEGVSPLENSVLSFLKIDETLYNEQKELTLKTTSILCS